MNTRFNSYSERYFINTFIQIYVNHLRSNKRQSIVEIGNRRGALTLFQPIKQMI